MSLGCPSRYTAEIRGRGGQSRVLTLSSVTGIQWGRQIGATSGASVKVVPRGRDCKERVAAVMPWVHELCVWRDDQRVWEGPVIDVEDDGTGITITARDVSAWLNRRIVHAEYDTIDEPPDVAVVALRMLADAFAPDDPDVIPNMTAHQTGILAARVVAEESVYASADLADLVALGLEWAVFGRRILLFGGSSLPLTAISPLGPKHFTGALPVTRAGGGVATKVIVQGGGLRGEAGGVHPAFGLHERLVTGVPVETDEEAAAVAKTGLYTPVLMIAGSQELSLVPRAPVTVGQLVPGVGCRVTGAGAALTADADTVLVKVSAEWAKGTEKVGVTFVELADSSSLGMAGG